jgi:6-hydroxycyclohex-1-ene-1-carbonyl-CoA dehydrogenase
MSTATGLFCTAPGDLELRSFVVPEPRAGEALVRVAGCGVCHTDIAFATGAVRTRRPFPLVLGHEISGTVEAAPAPFDALVGCDVLVPAVMPCDACDLCRAGRDTACGAQTMPGNDIPGGLASHVVVPARHLVPVPADRGGNTLAELAVVSDAVTTPFQAIRRASVRGGDLVVVIGVGGIGTYAVQIARALGARVAAIDVDGAKRERAASLGAAWVFDPAASDGRAIRKMLASEAGVCTARWRIFEMSGTARGQELAWALLPPAGTLAVVGFTLDKPDIRLSNLMALDATAFGSWGCSPSLYPAALDLVLSGAVEVRPFVELVPLAEGGALVAGANGHRPRRPILVP